MINGSTDIALRVTKKKEEINEIIDISSVDELKQISENQNEYIIRSGVTLQKLKEFSFNKLPALYKMLSVFGSKQIRNKATIGGNIGTASPIGDISMTLIAYNSSVIYGDKNDNKSLLCEFITGYRKTLLKENEIIKAVIIPKPDNNQIINAYKISKRKDLDISTVSAAFNLELSESNKVKKVVIAYGGMDSMIRRAKKIENSLIGKDWNEKTVKEASKLVKEEFKPISDARSSAEARLIMAKNLIIKFWNENNI
jgi:xanthine dehydrogenase small subunit